MLLLIALQASVPSIPAQAATGRLRAIVREAMPGCRRPRGEEIVVCARERAPPPWRYRRLAGNPGTRFDPDGDVLSVSRERHRLMEGGEAGIGSCGPVGAGGFTGCMVRDWRRNQQQHGN